MDVLVLFRGAHGIIHFHYTVAALEIPKNVPVIGPSLRGKGWVASTGAAKSGARTEPAARPSMADFTLRRAWPLTGCARRTKGDAERPGRTNTGDFAR
jgi:hypothetical protein